MVATFRMTPPPLPPPPPPPHTHTHTQTHTHTRAHSTNNTTPTPSHHHPPPPPPPKTYTTLVPIFAKKVVFFQMGGANSRNQDKRGNFAGMGPRNFEKGWNFACIYYHLLVPHVWIVMHKCISFNHNLEVLKNMTCGAGFNELNTAPLARLYRYSYFCLNTSLVWGAVCFRSSAEGSFCVQRRSCTDMVNRV